MPVPVWLGRQVGIMLDASAQHPGRTGRETLRLAALTQGLDGHRVDAVLLSSHLLHEVEQVADTLLLAVAMGLTLAMLFGSAAVSIVVYMAQPLMTSTLALIPGLATAMQWASANGMSLLTSGSMTGEVWARVAVSAGIWIVIPAVAGTVLSIRREIK